jgi:7,8-dihydropterin-6-yl-methyl-4-(beta-D-ribofuranosyl)aminobenzene 5'-phosphate synthase
MEIDDMNSTTESKNQYLEINQADAVEVLSLVDNSVDFMSTVNHRLAKPFGQWSRERYGQEWFGNHKQYPFAEHGFSMFIRVTYKGKTHSILFDTGSSQEAVIENSKRMGIDLGEVECIVLSHGHYDHFGGLISAIKAIGKTDLLVIAHKDMCKTRGSILPNGTIRRFRDFPTEAQISPARFVFTKKPHMIADNTICITGEVPRKTGYEKGYLRHQMLVNGSWQPDPLIIDDRAIVISSKGKGLIIISGCAHAGIINTINYAQQITSTKQVHTILGGFHLAGKGMEEQTKFTLKELVQINPTLIVPSHCTGWRAMTEIAMALPSAFVWNNVGNLYEVKS